jgi:hypothetical protein
MEIQSFSRNGWLAFHSTCVSPRWTAWLDGNSLQRRGYSIKHGNGGNRLASGFFEADPMANDRIERIQD